MRYEDSTLEWLVIGGGIHGSYITNCLVRKRFTARSDIRVIDPHDEPMARWKQVTSNTGMKFLRSPKVHHMDIEPFALKYFARFLKCENKQFIAPNERPSLNLFNRHANSVLRKSGLTDLFIKGRVVHIEKEIDRYNVRTENNIYRTHRILLSIGLENNDEWPYWSRILKNEGGTVQHVLHHNYSKGSIPDLGEIIIVGGGMTAIQTALNLSNSSRRVTVVSPHSLKVNNYDSDPGWMGPKYLSRYRNITCPNRRRKVINKARNSGSITHDLYRRFTRELKRGDCRFVVDRINHGSLLTADLMLMKTNSGENIAANSIVLATGYQKKRPGGALIDSLVNRYELKCATCGYPVSNIDLQWAEGLFVTGALAELEIGPASRNLVGARMAEDRIRRYLSYK